MSAGNRIEFMDLLMQLVQEKQQKAGLAPNKVFQEFYDKHKELDKLNNDFFRALETPAQEENLNTFQPPKPFTPLDLPSIKIEEIIDEPTTGSLKITEI